MSATRLTRELAAFISGLDADDTPAEARRRVIGGFIDCIGVMTAGAKEDPPTLLRKVVATGRGAAKLWPDGARAAPSDAALVNGTAAHALDYDDTGLKGHPSAVIVPAILAAAESAGASGSRMITAYLAGYETWAELISREQDQHPSKGWHITGIFGAIAAAAACASLRGLDAAATTTALALAASQSAGLLANFGTMAKPLHAGLAARTGIFSTALATAGFGASPDALEHPQGFLAAVSPAGRFDAAAPVRAGKEWQMLSVGLNVKKYPMCYCTHRPIDGALDLRARHGVNVGDIEGVEVLMSERNATILRHHTPQSELQARFSIEFAMAAALIAGQVGLEQLNDGFVQRADVQEFFPRVRTKTEVASDPVTGHGVFDKVVLRLRDGRVLDSGEIKAARGAAGLPLSPDEIYVKFADCLRVSRSRLDARPLFKNLIALEDAPDVSVLFAAREDAAA
jgi:2-methylcitrate dehydratase PrpD